MKRLILAVCIMIWNKTFGFCFEWFKRKVFAIKILKTKVAQFLITMFEDPPMESLKQRLGNKKSGLFSLIVSIYNRRRPGLFSSLWLN